MSTQHTAAAVRLSKGFGAGAGAAIAVIVVMGLARFSFGVMSIPELLQGALLRLVPGDLFEFMIHWLGPGAKVLLLVQVLEGILLVGGLLGWLFVRYWRPAGPDATSLARLMDSRYQAGAVYGALIGVGLILLFLLLFVSGAMNPQPSDDTVLPVSISLLVYGLVFGLTLVALLPWQAPVLAVAPMAGAATTDRRGFLRVAGGTALALVGGAGLWAILTRWLAEPVQASLVAADNSTLVAGGSVVDATATSDIATALAASNAAVATFTPGAQAAAATNTSGPAATGVPSATNTAGTAPTAANTPAATAVGQAPPAATATAPAPATATTMPGGPTATQAPVPATTAVAQAPPTATPFPAVPILSPEITPTENFYITTKNFSDPTLDGAAWNLTIKGLVANPITLTLADLKAMPQVRVIHTLECISNTVGGDLIGNGRWAGVRMADIMQKAGPQAGVVDALFRAADDYSDSVPLAALVHPETVLAYEMNGKPLVPKHGYPARLLIPGIFGMKNVKWLTSIELVNYDYKGFWQSQGWSDPAPYLTMSRIDYPLEGAVKQKPLYIGGIAFAGNRGIARVEVSVDAGRTWADAQLRRALSRNSWVLWTYPWVPTKTGDTTLVVRATDGTGQVQDPTDRNNYPDGATGYHRVAVKVTSA